MADVKPIPAGYASVTPYLVVNGAAKAIAFYERVLGAKERMRLPMGDRIGHAEIQIGDSVVMLADECPQMTYAKNPQAIGGTAVTIHVYVADVDAVFAKALAAGAKELHPVKDQFYGDRTGMFIDPFGHLWNVATHVEDVSPEEMQKRMKAMA
jgi:PhnB protein